MPTYHQILTWKEDDHGSVKATVVISDDYDEMYGDLTGKSTGISCIIIDKVSKSIKDLSGGAEQREIKMIIDEALSSPQDAQAISFIKSAENVSNIIFVALFIDTALDDIDPSSMIFNGVLQSNIEADDLLWHDNHFGKDINPLRRLKLTAKPYDMSVLAKFSMYDLIYGNDAQNVPGIDSTWEDENVKSRIAGFKWTEGITRGLYINSLVNLNDLLRKITDNLEAAMYNNHLGDINIKYSSSKVTGKWHHAKWNFERYKTFISRYVQSPYRTNSSSFRVLKNATNELYINPDGKPENFDLDDEGKHNNADTYLWLKRSPWVSYRRIKYYDGPLAEPSAEQWKEFRYSSICKDFPTFITQIASELGMFVKFYWSAGNTLNIKFYERNMSNFKVVKIKSATKAVIQPTSSNLDRLKNTADKVNVANYYAVEGADVYVYDNADDNKNTLPSPAYQEADKNIPILSLSPTLKSYYQGKDNGIIFPWAYLPHNYYMTNVLLEPFTNAMGVTTALYLYVDNIVDVPDDAYAPNNFWAPAVAMSINIEGEDHYYYTLTEFQRYISGIDVNETMYEYRLDIPYLYCASSNDEISWKHFDLLNYLQLDNTWYTIVAYEIDLKNVVVKLTLQSTSRFSFQDPELSGNMPEIPYTIVPETDVDVDNKIIVNEEIEGVEHLDFVAMLDDGTIVKAAPQRTLYHKLLGFAVVKDGVLRYVKTSGILVDNDLPDYPINTLVHLRYSDDSINISDTALTTSNGAEDMICIIGKYIDEKTIEIDDGFPHRYLLAPYNPA